MKIDKIGNIYGFTGGSFAGMVYGVNGCAPTLNTSGGAKRAAYHRNIVGKINSSQDGVIIHIGSIVPCLTSGHGNCPKIILEYENTEDTSRDKTGVD